MAPFAEIIPGVDGLIHISQIAPHRIEKPGDVLSEGQMVDVKIIAIDEEKHKVSLSIREALADNATQRGLRRRIARGFASPLP
ncbi:MAG: S1 RNA-binding domain-containing protein [Oscillospiraceae bacterium]